MSFLTVSPTIVSSLFSLFSQTGWAIQQRDAKLHPEVLAMDKTLTSDVTPEEANNIKAAIEDTCAEIARAIEQMKKDQAEIDQLKVETRAMLSELKAA